MHKQSYATTSIMPGRKHASSIKGRREREEELRFSLKLM